MAVYTIPVVARPISEDMFAAFGLATVAFTPNGQGVDVDTGTVTLTAAQEHAMRAYLASPDWIPGAVLSQALSDYQANAAYLAGAQTNAQAVAQVAALTTQVQALLRHLAHNDGGT